MLKFVVFFVGLAIVLAESTNEQFNVVKRLKPSPEVAQENTGVPDINDILGTDGGEISDDKDISFVFLGDESEENNEINPFKSSDFQYAIVPGGAETNKAATKNNDQPGSKDEADETKNETDEPKTESGNPEKESSESKEESTTEHKEMEKETAEEKEDPRTPESNTSEPKEESGNTDSSKQDDQRVISSSEEEEDGSELISDSKTKVDLDLDEKHQKEIDSVAESFGSIVKNALKKIKCDKQRMWAGLLINDVLLQGMNGKLTENTTIGSYPSVRGPSTRKVPIAPFKPTKSINRISSFFMPLKNNGRDTHIDKFGIPEIFRFLGIKPFPLFDDLFPFHSFSSLFDLK